jgi:hypothetical protein
MPDASTCSEFWWNWGVNAAVAAGTFAAVLVALFGQAFRAKFFPPVLTMQLASAEGEKTVARLKREGKGEVHETVEDCRYYHLRVTNSRRWSPANQVQVVLLQIEEPGPNGDLKIVWSGAVPLGWRHQQLYPSARTIGAPADVDLCSVVKGKCLQIHPMVAPFNLDVQRERPCTFVMMVQAQGSEGDSPVMRVEIAWDGKWHDGSREMQGHLSINLRSWT